MDLHPKQNRSAHLEEQLIRLFREEIQRKIQETQAGNRLFFERFVREVASIAGLDLALEDRAHLVDHIQANPSEAWRLYDDADPESIRQILGAVARSGEVPPRTRGS